MSEVKLRKVQVLPRHDSVWRPQQAEAGVPRQDLSEQVFQDQSTFTEIFECEIAQARVSLLKLKRKHIFVL